MEGGGQVHDVRLGCAGLEQRALEPGAGVAALEHGFHVAVVLEVVADEQRGAVGPGATAADPLAGAEGFDGDSVAHDDPAGLPDGAPAGGAGVLAGNQLVVDQFGLEVLEVGVGLVGGVGEDPDVGLAAEQGFAQGVGQGGDGRLGPAAGPEHVELGAAVGGHAVELVGHPLVHVGGGFEEVVGEECFAPVEREGQESGDRSRRAAGPPAGWSYRSAGMGRSRQVAVVGRDFVHRVAGIAGGGVRGRGTGVEESLAGGLDDASEQGPATAGGQAGHAKGLAGMNHGAVGIELEGWGEVGGEHGRKRGADRRWEIGDRVRDRGRSQGRSQGTGDRGQRTDSEYMYRLERNLGNIGTLGRKSLRARRKKFLWSDWHFLAGLWSGMGFCTYTFQRCKMLGEGRWRKWFWGLCLRDWSGLYLCIAR